MNIRYHNKDLLLKTYEEIKKLPETQKITFIKALKRELENAKYEFFLCGDGYTSPEEIRNRRENVYYCEDLLTLLNVEFSKEINLKKIGE